MSVLFNVFRALMQVFNRTFKVDQMLCSLDTLLCMDCTKQSTTVTLQWLWSKFCN